MKRPRSDSGSGGGRTAGPDAGETAPRRSRLRGGARETSKKALPGLFDSAPRETDKDETESDGAAADESGASAPGTRSRPLTIVELNEAVQVQLEAALPAVWIVGEISNLSRYASGHFYFTLKDPGSEISAVMFAGANRRLKFRPENGSQVLALGRPTLWVPRGRYQFIVEEMEPRGRGSLLEAFEALKQRLLAEGLFDSDRKRPLPALPARVGIVTSPDGAALRDILKVLRRRHAGLDVVIAPVRVQGEGAAEDIASGIEAIGRLGGVDVLIVGRGGGSIEDLWAFNEERVARAIAASRIPVISAVGHETDVTIADFVADVRAATPSQAAELVVASREELLRTLSSHAARLLGASRWILGEARRRHEQSARRRALAEFPARLADHAQLLDDLVAHMISATEDRVSDSRTRLRELALRLAPRHLLEIVLRRRQTVRELERRGAASAAAALAEARARTEAAGGMLRSLSPLNVLQRGYAICTDPTGRIVLRAASGVNPGDSVSVRLAQGALDCRVLTARPPQQEDPS